MKKLYILTLFFITFSTFSQTPGIINYQGVARTTAGVPITGNISVKVVLHMGSASGQATLTEIYNPLVNQFGIFEIKIGSQSPGLLTSLPWGSNFYFLGVSIDPLGGTNFGSEISNQQFVSVPYALYAEKAGSGASSPNTNVTASSNVTVTTSGTNTFNLNVPNYVAGSNVTITPLSGNNYQINSGISATAMSVGTTWTNSASNVFLVTNTDYVGIGTSTPTAKLEVSAGSLTAVDAIFASAGLGNGVVSSVTATSPTFIAVKGINTGGGTGVSGENMSTSISANANGVVGRTNSTSNLASGVYGENTGTGYGVYGLSSSTFTNGFGVYGKSVGSGSGVYGETSASLVNVGGVTGFNTGTGPGVKASLPTGTVAGGMNAALVVESGHVKSTQLNAPALSTPTLTGGPTGVSYTTTGCTDVKGSVLAVCTTTGLINIGGQVSMKVTFNKSYSVLPTVVVTPASDYGGMSYYVNSVTPTSFQVYLKNNTPGNLPGAAGTFTFNFNYMVME